MCQEYDSHNDNIIFFNQFLTLSDSEIERISFLAIQGDGQSAFELASHYTFGQINETLAIYWSTIGAENNFLKSKYNLAFDLLLIKNIVHNKRGIFWLRTAAREGDSDAKYYISRQLMLPIKDGSLLDDNSYIYAQQSLSKQEIEYCEDGALRGSGMAALSISLYYRNIKSDKDRYEYWFRIGAQNGNAECQYNYGMILYAKGKKLDRERGLFWLSRAAENGHELSRKELEHLKQ
ncbi:MAG: hypothetical protein Ta2B_10660 [Termitinemataceae bacterium]|nr:MAG: hypothetical protein Ta2B_10660 [Termitinemataceae bacterium]